MAVPDRIQGTDGIRSVTGLSADPAAAGLSPLDAFIAGVLTPEFAELYAYSFARWAIGLGIVTPAEGCVIGRDPRDTTGAITNAAIAGIRKGGLAALDAGILPTPAVQVYMAHERLGAGLMITASHNPKDQNGIKLFLGEAAMKLLPADDRSLTAHIAKTGYNTIEAAQLTGDLKDCAEHARETFLRFSTDPANIATASAASNGQVVIIDCANGCYSGLAGRIFVAAGYLGAEEINTDTKSGNVNLNSGVALLEGTESVPGGLIPQATAESPAGIGLVAHSAVRGLFAAGRARKNEIISGATTVSAAVFDADGDRFYRLEYDPFDDSIIVQNGDDCAVLQARAAAESGNIANKIFASSVECDIAVSAEAVKLGLQAEITPVGDKWLQLRALKTTIPAGADGDDLSRLESAGEFIRRGALELDADINHTGSWLLGAEESGHVIALGRANRPDGSAGLIFAGNGIRNALDTFAAVSRLREKSASPAEYFRMLKNPYPRGLKLSRYVYYVDKNCLKAGSAAWGNISAFVNETARDGLSGLGLGIAPRVFPQDPDMMYFELVHEKTGLAGSIFLRNSGTENKASVSVRAVAQFAGPLADIAEKILRRLAVTIKDTAHPYARAERSALETISIGTNPADKSFPPEKFGGIIDTNRLLTEMGPKQKLVELTGREFRLTGYGSWYLERLRNSGG